MHTGDPSKPGLKRPGEIRRKAMPMAQEALVKTGHLAETGKIPLVIEPAVEGLNLLAWAANNHDWIEQLLWENRALLFRGFHLESATDFYQFVKATSDGELLEYRDRSSPRHEVGDKIYTSTDYPADQKIFLHNEGTYWLSWPLKIYFSCLVTPDEGGETPIADCRRIFERISPAIRDHFIRKQVAYVRNYNDGFGLPWQTVFQTTDKSDVEAYCRRSAIDFEWKEGDRLRTRQVRPAVARHPKTGEQIWFNHAAFFHVSSLEPAIREGLLATFKEDELPYNTYYGDGTPIEWSDLEEIRAAYLAEKVKFLWQKGDVMLLDNMAIAHARESYVGSRTVIVGMADPVER